MQGWGDLKGYATLTNTNGAAFEICQGQWAIHSDGSDDLIDLSAASYIKPGSGDFTWSFWIQADTDSKSHDIISDRGTGALGTLEGFVIGSSGDPTAGRLAVVIEASDNSHKIYTADGIYLANTLYHFAVTWSNSLDRLRVYRNGVDITSLFTKAVDNVLTGKSCANSTAVRLLNRPGTTTRCWDGFIDDIRFYRRELQPSEITLLSLRRGIAYELASRYRSVPAESSGGGGGAIASLVLAYPMAYSMSRPCSITE